MIFILVFTIAWNSFILFWSISTFSIPFPGNVFFILFSLPFWAVGISLIGTLLFALKGQYICQIDSTEITSTFSLLGYTLQWPRSSLTADVTEVEFIDAYWQRNSKGGKTKVPPSLKLWVGNTEYSIGQFMSLKKPELLWLAQELSQWLDVPMTKTQANSREGLSSER